MLKLIGANPESGFAWFIYGITGLFVIPFTDLVFTWLNGKTILDVPTLITMTDYALFSWGMVRIAPGRSRSHVHSSSWKSFILGHYTRVL